MNTNLFKGALRNKSAIYKVKFSNFSNPFNDKEKMEEKIFIDKKERELMKKLLEKLQTAEPEKTRVDEKNPDRESLGDLLKKHNKKLPKELFNDLLSWKKGGF